MVELALRREPAADPRLPTDDHRDVLLAVDGVRDRARGGQLTIGVLPYDLPGLGVERPERTLQRLEEDEITAGREQPRVNGRILGHMLPDHVAGVGVVRADRAG